MRIETMRAILMAATLVSAIPAVQARPAEGARKAASARPLRLTRFGYGTIRIGMSPDAIRGYTLSPKPEQYEPCYTLSVKEVPGLEIMVTEDVVKRVSIGRTVTSSRIRTDRGIGIGSTEQAVRRAYRPLRTSPHRYVDAPAAYLTWLPDGGIQGLNFETGTDRRVTVVHAGARPALGYVEGCG